MKGHDSSLENLQMDLIEAPGADEGENFEGMSEERLVDENNEEDSDEGSRMIDLPYLFDD